MSQQVGVGIVRLPLAGDETDKERLKLAAGCVKDRLYVMLEGDWGKLTRPEAQARIIFVYDHLIGVNPKLDARVLLPGPKAWLAPHLTDIEAFISSSSESPALESWNASRTALSLPVVARMECEGLPCAGGMGALGWGDGDCEGVPAGAHDNVVLGGTFDRIHPGHKLLLAMSALAANKRLLIGVSEAALLDKKTLKHIMHPQPLRAARLLHHLHSVRPSVAFQIVPIQDPFGPSIVDRNLQCIVVSRETESGGNSVNRRRVERGLNELVVDVVDLIGPADGDETNKVSSTSLRRASLGKFCLSGIPEDERVAGGEGARDFVGLCGGKGVGGLPYVVGLTGGVACGKSTVATFLAEEKGVAVLDCDKLGHAAYTKGSAPFAAVVAEFGPGVVDAATGEIDRRALGPIVFSDPAKMQALNGIVWPAIRALALEKLRELRAGGVEVCVMEAAVLLEAGWDSMVDEVWVVLAPEEVACERLAARNSLSPEDAMTRIRAQMSNEDRAARAHVLLSNQWTQEVTAAQASEAWGGVEGRSKLTLASSVPGDADSGLVARWAAAGKVLGVPEDVLVTWWRRLWGLYTGHGRFYHTLEHLRAMFAALDSFGPGANPEGVAMAVFFHDAVYDPLRSDNEALSAKEWDAFVAAANTPSLTALAPTVSSWILRTAAHHAGEGGEEGDLALFLDADLAILGSSPPAYAKYAARVHLEYSCVPLEEFFAQRAAFLASLLALPSLYFSPAGKGALEAQARQNLAREKASLDQRAASLAPYLAGASMAAV